MFEMMENLSVRYLMTYLENVMVLYFVVVTVILKGLDMTLLRDHYWDT